MSQSRVRRVLLLGPARLTAVIVALWLLPPSTGAAGRTVSFRADDGRSINGLLVEASQRPASAVVLVPMLGRSKDDWQPVADRLADAGVTALAIDLPGLGNPGDAKTLQAWHTDVIAAVGYLSARSEVRASSIGVAGASLGANLAALAAAADSRVRSIALVSPSLDYQGVRIEGALRQYGSRPALLLSSSRDPYGARSARELARDAPGIRELRWSDTVAHGTVLLSRDPDTAAALIEWFRRTLG
jgi:alpha-beta hydrolase superfamily lysophospholipase